MLKTFLNIIQIHTFQAFRILKYCIFTEVISFIILLLPYTQARISVMYAHEKMSDFVAEQCLNEMFPKGRRIQFEESDEPCIIYCVLKKLGIMNTNGQINVDMYR